MAQAYGVGKSELDQQLLAALEENTRAQRFSQIVGLASVFVGVALGLRWILQSPSAKPVIDVEAVEV